MVALRNTTREMFDHMMSADSVGFHRVLIAEASRFPALVSRTFDHTIGPFSALTVRLLRAAVVNGQLRLADPERLFGLLTGLLTGWPHQQAVLGREVLPPFATAKLAVGRKIPQRIGRLAVDADLEIQRADLMRPRAHVGDDLPHRYRLTFMHQ